MAKKRKAKPLGQTRKIGGKTYRKIREFLKKSNAEKLAKAKRKQGMSCRVIESKASVRNPKEAVYCRSD